MQNCVMIHESRIIYLMFDVRATVLRWAWINRGADLPGDKRVNTQKLLGAIFSLLPAHSFVG